MSNDLTFIPICSSHISLSNRSNIYACNSNNNNDKTTSITTSINKSLVSSPRSSAIPHATPLSPPFSLASSLLWFTLPHLRLADNPAVLAASLKSSPVLPIATLTYNQLTDSVIAALTQLRDNLVQLGSTLIVRIVQNPAIHFHIAALCQIVDHIHVNTIYFNHNSPILDRSAFHPLKRRCVSIFNFDSTIQFLSDSPKFLPPPPSPLSNTITCDLFQSNISLTKMSNLLPFGENTAQTKLFTLLNTNPSYSQSDLFDIMSEELQIGCLSKFRLISEFERYHRHQHPDKPVKRWRQQTSSTFQPFFMGSNVTTPALITLSIAAYDVNGGDRRGVKWDESTKCFVLQEWEHTETERRMRPKERVHEFLRRRRQFFTRTFFPDDVTPDYYSFTAWRFAQRCVSATIGVFGTQSLLFALGIRSGRIGQAAVISWVLKDGLGRVGKMIWAGSMGKDFDVDPKRWRFRSALLYALGNGLEIVTQIFPASFLVFATAANSMKQMSMLTSSATRNAMYRSFGERTQNIANITAKGEAQIVVADLIGMACGIRLSKIVGPRRANVLGAYTLLTLLDIFGIYMELRSVVFRSLNAERSSIVVNRVLKDGVFLSPSQVSPRESIFLKPKYKKWVRLSSIAKAGKDPQELDMLLRVFKRERFMVSTPSSRSGPCRLVLRNDATNEDVLRAMLLVGHVQREFKTRGNGKQSLSMEETERLLRCARTMTKRTFPSFVQGLKEQGWNIDNLLFSTMKRRGYWRS